MRDKEARHLIGPARLGKKKVACSPFVHIDLVNNKKEEKSHKRNVGLFSSKGDKKGHDVRSFPHQSIIV